MIRSTDSSRNVFKKIPKKFHHKTVQSNILWLKLNKINKFFLQSAHKQGNPSFHFHAPGSKRRYPCTQTASAVPKYVPSLLQFCTGYRIWHASWARKRKTSEKCSFSHNKKYPDTNQHFFVIFRRILKKLTSDLFIVVWPVHTFQHFFLATIRRFVTPE